LLAKLYLAAAVPFLTIKGPSPSDYRYDATRRQLAAQLLTHFLKIVLRGNLVAPREAIIPIQMHSSFSIQVHSSFLIQMHSGFLIQMHSGFSILISLVETKLLMTEELSE